MSTDLEDDPPECTVVAASWQTLETHVFPEIEGNELEGARVTFYFGARVALDLVQTAIRQGAFEDSVERAVEAMQAEVLKFLESLGRRDH